MTKSPYHATKPHVSIIGHITSEELLSLLSSKDALNGFGNRFLWIAVRRSKSLPFGGEPIDFAPYRSELGRVIEFGRTAGQIDFDRSARSRWPEIYEGLTMPKPGLLGSLMSRAAPHVLRLAAIYAILDKSRLIARDHLEAGFAIWEASARCAEFIFGDSLGSPDAEKILAAIRAAPCGLTRSEIRSRVFQRNKSAELIKAALRVLLQVKLIVEETDHDTGGAPAIRYRINAIDAINAKTPPISVTASPLALTYGVNGVNGVPASRKPPHEVQPRREVFEL